MDIGMRRRGDTELGFISFGTGIAHEVAEDQEEVRPEADLGDGCATELACARPAFCGRCDGPIPGSY